MIVELDHIGGSRRGQSQFVPWGVECLVKLDRLQAEQGQEKYCPTHMGDNRNSPWFLLGTLVHYYMEHYFKNGNTDFIEFVDSRCGGPGDDFQSEAFRLFQGALPWIKNNSQYFGEVLAVEKNLDGPYMQQLFGVDITGRVDLVVRGTDGLVRVVDWKTAGEKTRRSHTYYMETYATPRS